MRACVSRRLTASGNYAVATNVSRSSACSNGVCTFTDTQAALQPYSVAVPTYFPLLDFWPGNLVLSASQDSNSVLAGARAWMDSAPSNVVAVQGSTAPALIATNCDALSGWTPLWLSCYSAMAPAVFYEQGAFLLAVKPNADGGLRTNLKGRMNFSTLGTGPGHIITLSDSNFQKTIATANNRPTNDANDAFIGYDQGDGNPMNVGISLRRAEVDFELHRKCRGRKEMAGAAYLQSQNVYCSSFHSIARAPPRL